MQRARRCRSAGLAILVLLTAACATRDSFEALRGPNVVRALEASQHGSDDAPRLRWRGTYSRPPRESDLWELWVFLFSQDIDKSGDVALPPKTRLCAHLEDRYQWIGVRELSLVEPDRVLAKPVELPVPPEVRASGCTLVMLPRLSNAAGASSVEGFDLIDLEGRTTRVFSLPPERPLLDPRRWLRLAVAPVYDTVVAVVLLPTVAYVTFLFDRG